MSRKKMSVQELDKKRNNSCLPNRHLHNKPRGERQNREQKPVLILVPVSHKRLTSRKHVMGARNFGAHVRRSIRSTQGKNGIRNWSPAQPIKVQETSKYQLVKILEKESSNKISKTCEKMMFTSSNPIKATSKSYHYGLAIRTSTN